MKSKKTIVIICLLFCVVLLIAVAVTALHINTDKNVEKTETPSVQTQNDSLEVQKVLNPLNVEYEVVEKFTAEEAIKALSAEAKSNVQKCASFELKLKETAEFFSLDHMLRYYNSVRNTDEYLSSEVSDVVSIDITADKGNEDNIQAAEYMTFLVLLFNTYPDCVGFLDYKYVASYNRNFSPRLVFCPDYAEYGYETIYDYIDAVLRHEELRLENAYFIRFDSNRIEKGGSDINLYDTIFNNTVSK